MITAYVKKIVHCLSKGKKRYLTPNKFAARSRYEVADGSLKVFGYQQYEYDCTKKEIIPSGQNSIIKFDILNYFLKVNIKDATLLDIGSNNGLFVYLASLYGAKQATGYDIDEDYVKTSREVNKVFGYNNIKFDKKNFENIEEKFDYVIFLSMLHWVYNRTSFVGSLDKIIQKLADMTNKGLIIEWVSGDDHKIQNNKHLNHNLAVTTEAYTFENFDKALRKYFKHYELLGVNTPTRLVYVAWK